MLSDGTLRGLKPEAAAYKVADRDGIRRCGEMDSWGSPFCEEAAVG